MNYFCAASRDQLFFGFKFEIVEATDFVESDRHDPAQCEKAHDEISERAEIVMELGARAPEPSFEMKGLAQPTEGLDTSNHQRDDDRHGSDRYVVVEFANGLYKGPSIRA